MFFLDTKNRITFAKTHSLISDCIKLKSSKNYNIKLIHKVYMQFKEAIFWTENYEYFTQKLLLAQKDDIPSTLVHDFKRFGRNSYKLSDLAKKSIKYYYMNPKNYNRVQITEMVNEELISRGFKKISYSSVCLYLKNNKIQNQLDILRKGEEFSKNNLLPYLTRNEPAEIGDLYQVDSTRINIPYYSSDEGKICYLYLCVIMDVFSRKIIGHSFSESENYIMIMESLHKAFKEFKIIPKQIVIDNHSGYRKKEFLTFKEKVANYGVHVRAASPRNPRDKGHVERWFSTFQSYYLNRIFGNLGFGIKTKTAGKRAYKELEQYYKHYNNLRDKQGLVDVIAKAINSYNLKKVNELDYSRFLHKKEVFTSYKIADLFYSSKRIKISRSMVRIQINKRVYTYTINNLNLSNSLNNKTIIVKYDYNDPIVIYLFDIHDNNYLASLTADNPINIIPNKKDMIKIKEFNKKQRDRMQKLFDNAVKEADEVLDELESIPILFENNTIQNLIDKDEDKRLISDLISIRKKRMLKKKIADTNITNNIYNKVKGRRMKTLKTKE